MGRRSRSGKGTSPLDSLDAANSIPDGIMRPNDLNVVVQGSCVAGSFCQQLQECLFPVFRSRTAKFHARNIATGKVPDIRNAVL